MQNRLCRLFVITCLVSVATFGAPDIALAQVEPGGGGGSRAVDLSDVDAIAVDALSGAAATADAGRAVVTLYKSLEALASRKEGKEINVGPEPVALLHQRLGDTAHLFVGCRGDGKVQVLDPLSNV